MITYTHKKVNDFGGHLNSSDASKVKDKLSLLQKLVGKKSALGCVSIITLERVLEIIQAEVKIRLNFNGNPEHICERTAVDLVKLDNGELYAVEKALPSYGNAVSICRIASKDLMMDISSGVYCDKKYKISELVGEGPVFEQVAMLSKGFYDNNNSVKA